MRTALITGVSRRAGIGFAIARRLIDADVRVFAHHHVPHDLERRWGGDAIDEVLADLGGDVPNLGLDLVEPGAPERLLRAAGDALGHIDILVCNHASSGPDGALGTLTAPMLDHHYAVNTRASLLLVQAFAAQHDGRSGGRVVLMTSGRNLGPM
ncbi:MAG TPA: SDR family NAD(P)-dependent oxidoreductase, partial [Solirubrobacter sp.]